MQFIAKVNKGPGKIGRPDTVFYTHCEFTKFPYLIFRGLKKKLKFFIQLTKLTFRFLIFIVDLT